MVGLRCGIGDGGREWIVASVLRTLGYWICEGCYDWVLTGCDDICHIDVLGLIACLALLEVC